ncbi:recombinase [bacterium D16-54]|nr:recombinase [bacterium D16-54]RKJ14478.1 recombinase [bacterium D16-56]
MARVSRKAAQAGQGAQEPFQPERVYHAAVYARLSVEDNNRAGDRESIAMQKYMLEKYVEVQEDMRLDGVFCDNGETGTNFERPQFERLMEEVKRRRIDCIVVKDLSRFGRNYVETGYYLEKIFPYLGVRFVAVNDGYDTKKGGSGSELVVSLKNLVNDLYAKDISQKITASLEIKQKKGEFIGAFPPYGYLKSPKDKHKLIPDPETAAVVREIFRQRADGTGINRIARYLNERKIPSPSMYHYLKGRKKKKPEGAGAIWQGQMIKLMTKNPMYAGHMAQGKTKRSLSLGMPQTIMDKEDWQVVYHTHEALISQGLFDKVQSVSEQRHEECRRRMGKYPLTENVFKGLVVCADCGMKMVRYKDVSRAGTARYTFICRVYAENLSGQGCTRKCIGEPELKEAVFHGLRIETEAALKLEDLLKRTQQKSGFRKKQEALAERVRLLKQDMGRNAAYRAALFESFSDHTLTEQEYVSLKQEYDRKAAAFRKELGELEQEEQVYSKTMSPQNQWIRALKKCRTEETVTREMAVELIDHIKVTGYNEIEIVWNFKDEFTRIEEMAVGI